MLLAQGLGFYGRMPSSKHFQQLSHSYFRMQSQMKRPCAAMGMSRRRMEKDDDMSEITKIREAAQFTLKTTLKSAPK